MGSDAFLSELAKLLFLYLTSSLSQTNAEFLATETLFLVEVSFSAN